MAMDRLVKQMRERVAEYERVKQNLKDEDLTLRSVLDDLGHITKAQDILQKVAESCQERAHKQIACVVTECLESVFGDGSYDFQILFDRKRGKTEARLVFVRNGAEIDPLTASGGGVVDVASFALRLACLVLSRPRRRLFLCLDEPLKHLSAEYREKMGEMVLKLSRKLGVQILMVTHVEEFTVGKVVQL